MTRVLATLCLGVLLVACDDAPRPSAYVPIAPTPGPAPSPPTNYGRDPIIGAGISISVGDVVEGTITPDDVPCFPFWDLTGRCWQYDLTPSGDGTLELRLHWTDQHRTMTLFIVNDAIGWQSSDRPGTPLVGTEVPLNLPVSAGHTYHVLVMSYSPPQSFQMSTQLRSD